MGLLELSAETEKRARQAAETAYEKAGPLTQPRPPGKLPWPSLVGTERVRKSLRRGGTRSQKAGSGREVCTDRGCKLYPDGGQEPAKNLKQGIDMNRLVISKPW